jgi:hypothetical protein
MALVVADRVWETTSTSGTGTLTLSGAVSGYQTFAAIGNGNTTYYTITNGTDWEVGIGTYTSSGTTLSRDTVLSSSSGGSKITVTPGSFVFVDYPASKAVYEDASDNVTGYSISGGTINGTTLGATTPAAGTFTTITGQTEVLKGTGQNLFTYSQTFTNGVWSSSTATRADNQTTAPNGTTTAGTITTVNTTFGGLLRQFITFTSTTYTLSAYVKKNNWRYVGLRFGSVASGNLFAFFDFDTLATNTVGISGATLTATDAGSGWYRLALTGANTTLGSTVADISTVASDGSCQTNLGAGQIVNVWGAQLEIGSTANTYIPTTTTAIYGTPTLSFSGVAGLGLESNGALYVSPAGTGALQAQATTSSTVGGNARGANAVDWQTVRATASQVASGSTSFIGNGRNNTSNNQDCFVGAGFQNTASSSQASVVSGARNNATSPATFIGGGYDNATNLNYATVVGGQTNTASGYFGFVGNGSTNSTTSSSAVTTQSGTMNGTTAVTLSGSNANIKVGQMITGTSITFPNTYVAAISGTSLTLSQVASGSSTSTLSFFTPHGVVVGGGNNQATGSYSAILGGGDAGTAANRNTASGAWSVVVGGRGNISSGISSFVGAGGTNGDNSSYANTASGVFSAVVAGGSNFASSEGSFVGAGFGNNSNGTHSTIVGGVFGTARGIVGNAVFPACSTPVSGSQGASQAALLILGTQTTDATATALRSNNSAASGTNQVILPNNSAYFFRGEVVSGVTGGGDTKGWTIEGVIKRGAGVGTTALVGTPTVVSGFADVGAATWTIAVTADTTNGGLRVTFTGQASTTIRTVCQIRTTEMTY